MTEPSTTLSAPSAAGCPPHHWLVVDQAPRVQQWTCYRCGAEHYPVWAPPDEVYVHRTRPQATKGSPPDT